MATPQPDSRRPGHFNHRFLNQHIYGFNIGQEKEVQSRLEPRTLGIGKLNPNKELLASVS